MLELEMQTVSSPYTLIIPGGAGPLGKGLLLGRDRPRLWVGSGVADRSSGEKLVSPKGSLHVL